MDEKKESNDDMSHFQKLTRKVFDFVHANHTAKAKNFSEAIACYDRIIDDIRYIDSSESSFDWFKSIELLCRFNRAICCYHLQDFERSLDQLQQTEYFPISSRFSTFLKPIQTRAGYLASSISMMKTKVNHSELKISDCFDDCSVGNNFRLATRVPRKTLPIDSSSHFSLGDCSQTKLSFQATMNESVEEENSPVSQEMDVHDECKSLSIDLIIIDRTYSLSELQYPGPYPEDVQLHCREMYLADEEFQATFHMSKHEFHTLQEWRKIHLKKMNGLF